MKQLWTILLMVICMVTSELYAGGLFEESHQSPAKWDTFSDTWVATDGLGRFLPAAATCGLPRSGGYVGIFYFLWLQGKSRVYDLTKIVAANPSDPAYGPVRAFHVWGEPFFGYHRSDDESVIRKHAQMLNDAGVDGRFDDWRDVTTEFRDTIGDPVQRHCAGWKNQPRFVNDTGRNDIVAAKASMDATNINFYVRARDTLTKHTGPNWMLLFIDVDRSPKPDWLGCDFIGNRSNVRTDRTTVERNIGGKYQWRHPVDIAYRYAGNQLELVIPRTVLGLSKGPAVIDFKWADNIQQTGDWSDFTLNGDPAPNDRFNCRAILPSVADEMTASTAASSAIK